ncbi:integrase core domain-containing protein [Acinetobacter sp. HR7]|uniref:integrase core domain-containing protein n=1 Tax=Acinetobacter sp. HR7 TaxID=1509403 RepID=UPI00053866CE|nr:integrase core domain-containing protein [Acinetobacter sp. HR7]KGT48628.1 hypothetical protein GW12_03280 [Acinetobacter sp. HR7]
MILKVLIVFDPKLNLFKSDAYIFMQQSPLDEVQDYATNWLWHYNHERPHQANKGKPPLMAA